MKNTAPFIFKLVNPSSIDGLVTFPIATETKGIEDTSKTGTTLTYQNTSLKALLSWVNVNSALIGKTVLQSSNQEQIEQQIQFVHASVTGGNRETITTPVIDPYQKQDGINIINTQFLFSDDDRIRVNMLAGSKLTIKMYPIKMMSKSQAFGTREFEMPTIIRKFK